MAIVAAQIVNRRAPKLTHGEREQTQACEQNLCCKVQDAADVREFG